MPLTRLSMLRSRLAHREPQYPLPRYRSLPSFKTPKMTSLISPSYAFPNDSASPSQAELPPCLLRALGAIRSSDGSHWLAALAIRYRMLLTEKALPIGHPVRLHEASLLNRPYRIKNRNSLLTQFPRSNFGLSRFPVVLFTSRTVA